MNAVAGAETSPHTFPAPRDIRNAPTSQVVRQVLNATEVGIVPSGDAAQALLSRYVSNLSRGYDEELPPVPWPETAIFDPASPPNWLDRSDVHFYGKVIDVKRVLKGEVDTRPEVVIAPQRGYVEIDDPNDALLRVAFHAIEKLPDVDRSHVVSWMVDLIDEVPAVDLEDYLPRVLTYIKNSPRSTELFTHVLNYLYRHADEYYAYYEQDTASASEGHGGWAWDVMWRLGVFDSYRELVLRSLAQRPSDGEVKRLLGMMILEQNYADMLTTVQRVIKADPESPLAKRVERVGRLLLGRDPDEDIPFLTASYELYQRFHLDKYTYLEQELPQDLEVFGQVLAKINELAGGEGNVVELGSGDGGSHR